MNDELEKNLDIGTEIYSLVIHNKLQDEDKFNESEDYYTNNFLNLSLKNNLIKGMHQKFFQNLNNLNDDFCEKNFQFKIILGIFI